MLTWLTLSSVFHFAQQVAVSPPPVVQTRSETQEVQILFSLRATALLQAGPAAKHSTLLHTAVFKALSPS